MRATRIGMSIVFIAILAVATSLRVSAARIVTQDFTWGVLAMNPNKDVYTAGEKAKVDIGVLDDHGEIVCDADLTLQIIAPSGAVTTLTTDDASITVTGTCAKKEAGFIEPDFTALFSLDEAGTYHLKLTAVTPNGERQISSDVLVTDPTLNPSLVIISRTSATRLWPFAPAPMRIAVKFNENFTGTIRDIVPAGFIITDRGDATLNVIVDEQGMGTTLSWKGSWKAGETATFSYVYDAPDISPEFYLAGPLTLTSSRGEVFSEHRQWQIANDGDGVVNTRTWDNGGGTGLWSTATNWTSDTVPDSDDIAYFGTTSTANATVNASFAGMVGALKVAPGYTGTITLSRNLTLSGGSLALSGGTLDFSNAGRTLTVSHDFVTYPKARLNAGTGTIVLTGSGTNRVLTSTGAFSNLTLNSGLVGYWKFDEGVGTVAKDSSGNGNNGTLTNGPTWSTSVPSTRFYNPKSLSFDGSNDYVSLGSIAIPTAVSVWFLHNSPWKDYSRIFSWVVNEMTVFCSSSGVCTMYYNGSAGPSTNALTAGTWYHLVAQYKGDGKAHLYINGTEQGTATSLTKRTGNFSAYIGSYDGSLQPFNGFIDDVRIYNRALSNSEVARLAQGYPNSGSGIYTLGSALSVGNLSLYNSALDVSSSNYGVTLSGSFINAGNFVKQSGTVTFNGTTQTISGSTVFHNLTKTVTTARTLFMDYTSRQSVSGALTLRGASSNLLSLRSTRSGSASSILLDGSSGVQTIDYLNVKDSNATGGATLECLSSSEGCVNSGNTTNWSFTTPLTITGKVYSDEGTTPISGVSVAASFNGSASVGAGSTDAGGQYTISPASAMTGGTIIALYLDGASQKAVTVTLGSGSSMTGMHLYQNRLIVRSDSGSVALTNAHLNVADNNGDSDITALYAVDANGIVSVASFKELYVWSGDTFTPGTRVGTHDLEVKGTLALGTNGLTVAGSLVANAGTMTTSTGVTLLGTGSLTVSLGTNAVQNISFGGNAYPSLQTGLVGHWKFDDGAGTTALDATVNAKNGTLTNGPTWSSSVPTLQFSNPYSISFDGANDYVALPATSLYDLQTLTMSVWAYSTNFAQNGFLFEKTTNGLVNTQYSCFFDAAAGIYFRTVSAGPTLGDLTVSLATAGVTNSQWNHIACVYNGSTKKIYVNGVEKASVSYSLTLSTGAGGTSFIGVYGGATNYFFNGKIDDVRLYNRGITATEVTSLAAGYGNSGGTGSYILGSALDVNGTLLVNTGSILSASSYNITVAGNWWNKGTFTKGTSTVTFDGSGNQTISGSTVFNNLSITTSAARTVFFDYSSRQSASGALTLRGASSNLLSIRSTLASTAARILLDGDSGTQTIDYLNVKDSNASGGAELNCSTGCTDSGNNTNWTFVSAGARNFFHFFGF